MRIRGYSLALGGLFAVLLTVAVLAFWSASSTNQTADRSAAATRLSDAFEQARYAVGAEESLERKYRLEPGPAVRQRYATAAKGFADALAEIGRRGDHADRLLVTALQAKQRGYLVAIDSMFDAVDAHQTERVLAIDRDGVDPLFGAIETRVEQAALAHTATAGTRLASLRTSEQRVLVGTAIAIAVGLALLTLFAVFLVRINRELRRSARQSEHNALHDDLTGLPNRRLLLDRLEQLVAGAVREPQPFSLLMIDLDRFKEINDTLGHSTGDLLLRAIGPRLQPLLRPADTLARIGGDEFVILLPTASLEAAGEIAERARRALSQPIALPDFVATVDSSIGIVSFPRHGEDAETLMQRADIAMYLAKTQRTGDAIYDPVTDPYDPQRLSLIADLRGAIAARTIEVYYQPKFDVKTLQPVGVEALARWDHPERGMISPGEFIPLAEHTGLIKPLTELVLRQAVRQCRSWQDAGRKLPVAVNLSVANLLDVDLVHTVRRILEEEGVTPAQLQLEITESMIMVDPERARHVLLELAEMGVALSVDDFGTGYSSLAYLRRLPVQELKIDQSFIKHLAADNEDAAVVRATIQLGHSLGLTIVAEGVEDARSLERLAELGCDSLQGFHLCVPQPPESVLGALDALEAHALPARFATI